MPDSSVHPLESILRLCAEKAPEPWYPSAYARETGTPRDSLDPHLDQLRMAGLIRLTDWVAGQGQGYTLTPAGAEVLQNSRQLARLVAGKWSPTVVRENRPTSTVSSPWERGEAVRAALLYPAQPILTFILIAVNVGIFVIRYVSTPLYEQIEDLAVASPVELLQGQWWRLLTTAFLHGNELHVGFNMYALYALGQNAERIWGHARYLAIYLIGALGCTCLALTLRPVPCIGASGAICGIFAAEAAWVYYHRQHLDPRLFFAWQRNFMINLVLLVFISFLPRVSWQGHLGGAIAGLLLALWLNYFQFQPGWRRGLQWLGVLVISAVSVGLLIRTMHSSSQWRQIRSLIEVRDFEKSFIPRDRVFLEQMDKMLEETKVINILERHPTRRDSRQVEDAITGLKTLIASLEEEQDELSRAGPYTTPKVKEAQRLGLRYLESLSAYFGLMIECLKKGKNWTEKDEDRMLQQKEEMKSAFQEWEALVR